MIAAAQPSPIGHKEQKHIPVRQSDPFSPLIKQAVTRQR